MEGYTLLTQTQYALVYLLTAVALAVSAGGTFLGLFAFGDVVWWPTIVLLVLVFLLELHGFYERNLS